MATHSSTLVWKISGMEEPDGLQSMGLRRVGHDWALKLFTLLTAMETWQDISPLWAHGLHLWNGVITVPNSKCWGLNESLEVQCFSEAHSKSSLYENPPSLFLSFPLASFFPPSDSVSGTLSTILHRIPGQFLLALLRCCWHVALCKFNKVYRVLIWYTYIAEWLPSQC